ncbi:MAG: hypothetical protein ACK58N_14015 [Synechocystis sp.]
MFKNFKYLGDRLLPAHFKSIIAGILSLVMVITSGFWWFPVLAQKINGIPGSPSSTMTISGEQIPVPSPKFGGVINRSVEDSKPFWPSRIVPPKGVVFTWMS